VGEALGMLADAATVLFGASDMATMATVTAR
jgi:hypothetical protein